MSTNLKKTLAATLAAAIASGMAITPAMANGVDVDALYATAYEATVKAEKSGLQEDINAARKAIAALEGTGAEFAIGEFSKIVDGPQQVILTKIVDGITELNAMKTPDQAKINEIRDMATKLPNTSWMGSYTSALDTLQQVLITNAETAVNKAKETGLEADIAKAKDLLAGLKTATNNEGVIKWAKTVEAELEQAVGTLKVESVKISGNKQVTINFNKVVNKTTVGINDFSILNKDGKSVSIANVEVKEGNKEITLTLGTSLVDGEYTVKVSGIAGENNKLMDAFEGKASYKKGALKSVTVDSKLTFENGTVEGNLDTHIKVTDSEGRKVSRDELTDVTYTSNNTAVIDKDGNILEAGKAIITITATRGDETVKSGNITVEIVEKEEAKATTLQGFSFDTTLDTTDDSKVKYSEVKNKVTSLKKGETAKLYVYYLDQYGEELKGQEVELGLLEDTVGSKYITIHGNLITADNVGKVSTTVVVGEGKDAKEHKFAFEIKDEAKATSIKVSHKDVKLAVGSPLDVKVEVLDQHGDVMSNLASEVTVTGNNQKVDATINEGVLTITANEETEESVELILTHGKISTKIVVNVAGNQTAIDYKVDLGTDLTVDRNVAKEDTTVEFKVSAVNDKGALVDLTSTCGITVLDENGNEIGSKARAIFEGKVSLGQKAGEYDLAAGTYDVVVKHGTHEVETLKITVIDTSAKAESVSFHANSIVADITSPVSIRDAVKEIIIVFDQYGKVIKAEDINNIDVDYRKVNDSKIEITGITIDGEYIKVSHQEINVTSAK